MTDARAVAWDEVEWRVDGKVDGGGGVRVVPYLDAPTVVEHLEAWAGELAWRDFYEPVKQGVLWCHIEVRDRESGKWIRRTDLGTASNMEADKGVVSDAFKRCAMRKWRVGANVFKLPNLRLPPGSFDKYLDRNGNDQARLTPKSLQVIQQMLRAAGHEDAATQARVNTDGESARDERGVVTGEASDEPAPPAPTPTPPANNGGAELARNGDPRIPEPVRRNLKRLQKEHSIDDGVWRALLSRWDCTSSTELSAEQGNTLVGVLEDPRKRLPALEWAEKKASR